MEVGSKRVVDKLLLLPPFVSVSRLVLEHYIVVPPPLDVEVWLIQQGIPEGNVFLPLFLLLPCPFGLFSRPPLSLFPPHPLQFPLKFCVRVVIAVAILTFVTFLIAIIRINISSLG